jgi:phosphatidylinositol-3,4,5-trisphosphate 3-phosphatase/dual-specificity protein phosphatase PTEN
MKSILKLSAQYMDKGDFGSLSKLIEEAESKKLDLYIGHKLKTEFGYLEQERRVYDIISSALLKGSFDELDAGQKQAEAIGVLNKTKSPDMIDLLKRAAEQRNVFLLHGQIRSKLEAAIIAEDLKSLEDTCLEAKQALMYHAVLDRAENLAIELKHDQRTFEELQNALNGHEMERMALFHFEASKCTRLNEERIKLLDECSKNLTEYFQQKLQNAIQKKTEEALVPILQLVEKSTIKQNVIKDFDVAESLLKSILEQQKHAEKQKFSLQKELLAKLEKKKQPDVKKPDPIPESVQESKPVELKNDEINVVQDDAQVPTVSDPAKENDEKEKSKVESKNNSQDIAAVNTEPEVLKRLEIDENKTSEKDKNDVDEDARKFATIRQKVQQFQLNSDNKNTDTVKSTERSISDDFKPDSVRLKIYNFQQQAKIQPMVNEMMEHQKSMDSAKEEMTKYVSEKNIEGLRNFISNLPKDPYFVRVLFTARENLQHMELEKKLLEELAEYVSLLDVTRMKEILNNLAEFEISRSSHKTIEEARRLCFATTSVELFAMKFNRAVEKGDAAALRELLPYAKENMIEEKEIRLASMWLNQQNIREWTSISSIMINETKNVMALIENLRNSSALQNYEGLRSADDFLKIAAYFSKKHISPHKMYVWQKELIQKSMLSFSNVEKSKQKSSSNDAKNCFKNVQMFMRDRYHPFPVSVAYDILRCAAENQNLQDELFCQLIKQTTENPSSESLLLGWKLLYICISTFPVQNESLFGVLSSHIANHIPKVVPSDYDSWIDSIESIAMVSFKTLRKMKRTEIVSIPSMETVRSIAESRLPIIKAKYPDSQVIEIRLRSSQMTVSDFCSYAFEYGKTSMFYYKLVVHVQDQSDVFHCDPDQSMVSVYLHWETQLRTGNIQAYSFELVILSKAASNDQIMPEESKSVQDVFNESNLPKTLERKATRRKSSARSNTDFNENPEDDNIRLDIECFENESKGLVPKKRIVNITNFLRRLVSKKKKRLQDSGFDLDLSYITDRIIAMGYPAEDSSFQSNYRNPYSEVYTFLEKFHAKNYKVYSLCAEYDYGTMKFNGSVAKYPFKDHQCPAFHVLIDCCEDLSHWLEQDGDHIAAVHCKAGKGRTGMMISCYLLYSQQCETAEEALHFFAEHRTLNHKGVAIPSQIRFVHYFQLYMYYILKSGLKLPKESPQCIIETISFSSVPNFSTNGGCHPYLVIRNAEDYIIFDSRSVSSPRHVSPSKSETPIEIGSGGVVVQGDLLFEFKNCDPLIKDSTMCHFWINTFFLPHSGKLNLKKFEIDGASKDVKNRRFSEDFCIKLRFSMLTASPIITFVSHN